MWKSFERWLVLIASATALCAAVGGQIKQLPLSNNRAVPKTAAAAPLSPAAGKATIRSFPSISPSDLVLSLYDGMIPNSTNAPDEERTIDRGVVEKVSRPTIAVYLPPKTKTPESAVIIFPGGAYIMEVYEREGTRIAEELRDRGIAAFVVKYRLPSDTSMPDKATGPLQDAQQAIRVVRQNAAKWNVDSNKIGVMGFSAGGHLAATVGTHFNKDYIPNPNAISLRPNFLILVYPVISMADDLTHPGARKALLGSNPTHDQIRLFSNEEQVTVQTPPTLMLHASDDASVDVDNSIRFYEALRHHHVPVEMVLFPEGGHGFPNLSFDEWFQPLLRWMRTNGWKQP